MKILRVAPLLDKEEKGGWLTGSIFPAPHHPLPPPRLRRGAIFMATKDLALHIFMNNARFFVAPQGGNPQNDSPNKFFPRLLV
jgi:hypothetical protein